MVDVGEPWRTHERFRDPPATLKAAINATSIMGVTQVHSALEEFAQTLVADVERWRNVGLKTKQPQTKGAKRKASPASDHVVAKACTRLGWSNDGLEPALPVLTLFAAIRHCAAHTTGIASHDVCNQLVSQQLVDTLLHWEKRQGAKPPELPSLTPGDPIVIKPRHTILALDAAYRGAERLNSLAVSELGSLGIIDMACHRFMNLDRAVAVRWSAEKSVNDLLASRYNAKPTTKNETVQAMKKLKIWSKVVSHYDKIYGTSGGVKSRPARPRDRPRKAR